MAFQSNPWRRFCLYGFIAQLSFDVLIAVLAYLGVLPNHLDALPHFDLLAHAILMGLVAFFADGLWQYRPLWAGAPAWLHRAPTILFGFVALEEAAQSLSPRRSCSWGDLGADLFGIVLFSFLSYRMSLRFGRPAAGAQAY